jgi:spore coat polysaccharide biosynthesis predicted glycosyltransferase SpsG/CMP-N-acetylneuraminic acid synthetase
MRLIKGVPMIGHTLFAIREAVPEARIVLSSDSPEARGWAEIQGFETLARPEDLAGPEVTIAQVAAHVADELDWRGIVGVFQPTSPLRSAETISRLVEEFATRSAQSMSTAERDSHLYWQQEGEGQPTPLFTARENRQFANSTVLRETGAVQLVRADYLRETASLVAPDHLLRETPEAESIDVDSFADLTAARAIAEQGDVVFRLRAEPRTGLGHLVHCLQLAEELSDQRLHFLVRGEADDHVAEVLDARGYAWRAETDLAADLESIRDQSRAQVLVNDVLDTSVEDVLVPKSLGFTVINIEDLGPGSRHADWVVNALYAPTERDGAHTSTGARWATLRHEFHGLPKRAIAETPTRLLITFGGTDPAGLTERFAKVLHDENLDVDLRVILGAGAQAEIELPGVTVLKRVESMAAEMLEADVVLTSAGRTVYEAASCGTPVIAVAQNAREATHSHISPDTGVVFLGIGPLVDDQTVAGTVRRLLTSFELRRELSERLQRSIDAKGAERIGHTIRGLMRGLVA